MQNQRVLAKNIFILGIGSDIGKRLAERYLLLGHSVVGTYRHKISINDLTNMGSLKLIKCDLVNKISTRACLQEYKMINRPWDIFISCVGTMEPIGKFFNSDFSKWEKSVILNSLSQLRFLHDLYPYRRKNKVSHVVFFAGGGTNSPFTNYSAYCVSKIMLIKMCELLDDENKDLNAFIVGPGWVRTKIHAQTLHSRWIAGANYARTKEFLRSKNPGTDYQDIFDCINWCIEQGRDACGGRNFSVIHDQWRKKSLNLAKKLRAYPDKFKLRRFKNEE